MLDSWLQSLQDSPPATAIREGATLFPWIECVHVLALTVVVGSIAVVDLRLIGWASRDRSVGEVSATTLPITWSAFAVALLTGSLLFSSNATTYAHNIFFQLKMALIVAAGANMGLYHLLIGRDARQWRTVADTPVRARITGAVSLCLWVAVVAFGRWIGFTINAPT